MSLRTVKIVFLATLSTLIMWSCQKEDITIDISESNWKVVKTQLPNGSTKNASGNYILKFVTDSTFTLNLDVNNCQANYSISEAGTIQIGPLGCTKVCCDDEFAENLRDLLSNMTSYYGKGNKLIFEGQGRIVLKRD